MTGVEEDAVSLRDGIDARRLDHRLDVLGRNDAGAVLAFGNGKPVEAGMGGGVQEDASADEALLRHRLDAEFAQPKDVAGGMALQHGLQIAPAIEEIAVGRADADMARAVELRADLAELGGHHLVVEEHGVLAERSGGRRAGDRHAPDARAEQGDVGGVELAERCDLALRDQADRVQHHVRRRAVRRADPVVGSPLAGPPVLGLRSIVHRLCGGIGC